jgi:threonine dehydrogenase-like Zn-dependent dehydrogenase
MLAWWRSDAFRFGECPDPEAASADDVRVRVVIAGLCRTDVAVARGLIPCMDKCVLGHEVAGIVESVGPAVRALRVGDRVACLPMVDGLRLGVDRHGGFAERIVLPERALVRVPEGVDWRRAAFVEPVAACLAVKRAPLHGSVRVLGQGRIATLTRRIVAGLGHADSADVVDVVIETAGTAEGLAAATRAVRTGGTIVLKSRPTAPLPLDIADVVVREIRLVGVGWASFPEAFALLGGPLAVDDLLGPVHPLEVLGSLLDADESCKHFFAPDPTRCAG